MTLPTNIKPTNKRPIPFWFRTSWVRARVRKLVVEKVGDGNWKVGDVCAPQIVQNPTPKTQCQSYSHTVTYRHCALGFGLGFEFWVFLNMQPRAGNISRMWNDFIRRIPPFSLFFFLLLLLLLLLASIFLSFFLSLSFDLSERICSRCKAGQDLLVGFPVFEESPKPETQSSVTICDCMSGWLALGLGVGFAQIFHSSLRSHSNFLRDPSISCSFVFPLI